MNEYIHGGERTELLLLVYFIKLLKKQTQHTRPCSLALIRQISINKLIQSYHNGPTL